MPGKGDFSTSYFKVGDKFINNKGLTYEILQYSGNKNVLVRFEDGFERLVCSGNVKKGCVKYKGHYIKIDDTFTNKQGCEYEVIALDNQVKALIKFTDANAYEKWCDVKEVRRRSIKNPYYPEIYGVGYFGVGKYAGTIEVNGKKKNSEAYEVWRGMLRRCYDENYQRDKAPAYKGCFVNPVWCNFQNFAYWFYNHPYRQKGWHLDKDIISRGNKEYSPLLCTFIPTQINSATTNTKAKRGAYPVGVYFRTCNGKFRAQLATYGSAQKMLIETTDLKLAFNTYKEAKEKYLRELADSYRDRIDPLVYKGLYNWTVSEDD